MRSTSFTIQMSINVLNIINSKFNASKGGQITLTELYVAISNATKKTHPNFIKQFVISLQMIGCIEVKKKVVTILKDSEELM